MSSLFFNGRSDDEKRFSNRAGGRSLIVEVLVWDGERL